MMKMFLISFFTMLKVRQLHVLNQSLLLLNNQELVSGPLKMIVAEFNFWVDKYGHQTY